MACYWKSRMPWKWIYWSFTLLSIFKFWTWLWAWFLQLGRHPQIPTWTRTVLLRKLKLAKLKLISAKLQQMPFHILSKVLVAPLATLSPIDSCGSLTQWASAWALILQVKNSLTWASQSHRFDLDKIRLFSRHLCRYIATASSKRLICHPNLACERM